ncbi:unnamed protein product [Mesocestoides corti]|uniref:SCP domain-containing protein n=1 Tax=Mesocestoides corti TaxID=53468 RepID=A0A0R3U7F8_MESCO|nr:unnamed protein product [Mesocestoides corti]
MELEGLADKWANKCTLEKPDAGKDVEYANTSITTDFTENKTYAEMIEKFGQQSYFYNYSTNKCKVPCSSYIQAVWADSKEVGCATNKCPGILPSQKADTLFICVYKPAGNPGNAKPYQSGTSCSGCPKDTHCKRNQCEKNSVSTLMSTVATLVSVILAVQCFV